jgi:hypothetical protein
VGTLGAAGAHALSSVGRPSPATLATRRKERRSMTRIDSRGSDMDGGTPLVWCGDAPQERGDQSFNEQRSRVYRVVAHFAVAIAERRYDQ